MILGGALVFTVFIAYLWVSSVESAIANQNARNNILEVEIANLEKQVKEISELKKVRDDLLARIKIIQDLQGTRPLIVRYFDDFARAIPDGIFITMVDRKGDIVKIEGVAESYNRIASLMRDLDMSDWFEGAGVESVVAAPKEGEQAQFFKMVVHTSLPSDVADGNKNLNPADNKKAGGK